METKFFKKSDALVIALLLAIGLISVFVYRSIMTGKPAIAQIFYFGDLVEVVELEQGVKRTIGIADAPGVILQQEPDGSIRFESSDCPDKVCVHTGKLSLIGESAACLPNGVLVKIVPVGERGPNEADIIVG